MVENIKLYNPTLGETLYLSMNDSPYYILKSCDFGQIQSERQEYNFINQIGAQVANITLGTREITISGWVISNESEELMTSRKSFLNRFFNPRELITVTYKDKTIKFYPDTSIQYTTEEASNNEVVCQFEITGVCPFPLFEDVENSSTANYEYEALFHFPLVIPQNEGVVFSTYSKSIETILSVYNFGDIETGMIISFSGQVELVNPRIVNVETGEYIKFNCTIHPGETLIISTSSGDKYIKCIHEDETESNYYPYFDLDSTWLNLARGENYLIMTADEGAEFIMWSVEFTNKYLEVQQWD